MEQGATSASWGLGWDHDGEKKMLEDKELSFSDAPAVYIDRTSVGEAVVSGRTHSGLVDGAKPGRDTLNRKEATLCRTGRRRTRR